jgi:ribulose-bisphosphate carboxylase large chain
LASIIAGPAFGIDGCRKLTGVNDRPMIGTIIKPSIGLSVQQTADIVKTLAEAGIDFIKMMNCFLRQLIQISMTGLML